MIKLFSNPAAILKITFGCLLLAPGSLLIGQNIPNGKKVASPAALTPNTIPAPYSSAMPRNYVRTWDVNAPSASESYVLSLSRTPDQVKLATQYFDGLGRTIQTVGEDMSPLGKDLVSMMLYDEYGRESFSYLPYTSTGSTGDFKTDPFGEQAVFLENYLNAEVASDPDREKFFYGKNDYESSPLNRVTKTYAPGNKWIGDAVGVGVQYYTNASSDSVCIWNMSFTAGSTPIFAGYYLPGELYETITADEHSNKVTEYKDKDGKVLLKKVQVSTSPAAGHSGWYCTYYVYDDLGNLRYVIPPKAVDLLKNNSWLFTAPALAGMGSELCFRYEYDARNRMIIKQVPGAGEVWMVYDIRDRLVMTQDAKLRLQGKWLYTDYDSLNRPVLTGLWTNTSNRTTHQAAAAGSVTYPNPSGSSYTVLTRTYYDNYNWVSGSGSGLSSSMITAYNNNTSYFLPADNNNAPYPQSITASNLTKGLVTGNMVNVVGSTTNLFSVSFYDKRDRLIQTHSNNFSGGKDTAIIQYSFSGQQLRTLLCHRQGKYTPQHYKVLTKMSYDAAGRVLSVTKKINNSPEVIIAKHQYDELGQLKKKEIGQVRNTTSLNTYTSNPIDSLWYSYNVRGWLRGINKDYARNDPSGSSSWFGMELCYDFGFSTTQLNGNIAGMRWRNGSDGEQRAYGFAYDAVSRLLKADFTQYTSAAWNNDAGIDFSLRNMGYDQNGNILKMSQLGLKLNTSSLIDSLVYGYNNNSNKLSYVTDKANDANSALGDFKERINNTSHDYTYDVNGSMVTDNNKNISAISYNYLNLPEEITVQGKGTILYEYDAAGNKLSKTTYDDSLETRTVTNYAGMFTYKYTLPATTVIGRTSDAPDTLQFITTEEGRARPCRPGSTDTMYYDYFEKDHLGNVRVVLTDEKKQDVYPVATMENNPVALAIEKDYYIIDDGQIVDETIATGFTSAAGNNYYNHNGNPPYNNNPSANTNAQSTRLYKLNGSTGAKTGLGMTLKVMAGDKIDIWAKSYYHINTGQTANNNYLITTALTEFINAFASGGAVLEKSITGSVLNNSAATTGGLTSWLNGVSTPAGNVPKAYLNWILFDEQFKPVSSNCGFDLVSSSPSTIKSHQKTITVGKSGYLFVYCSNESNINVFFDNLQVIHTRGPLLETTDYYPFGLTMSGISSKAAGTLTNKYKYNGIEKIGDFDLQDFDARFRELDPQIGRWWQTDPKIENMDNWSPYASMFDNPASKIDPLGDEPQQGDPTYQKITPGGAPKGTSWDNTKKENTSSGVVSLTGITLRYNGNISYQSTTTSVNLSTGGSVFEKYTGSPTFVKSVREVDITTDGILSSDGKTYIETKSVTKTSVTINDGTEVLSAQSKQETNIKTYSVEIGGSLSLTNEVNTSKISNSPDLSPALQNRVERALLINYIGLKGAGKAYGDATQKIYDQADKTIQKLYDQK